MRIVSNRSSEGRIYTHSSVSITLNHIWACVKCARYYCGVFISSRIASSAHGHSYPAAIETTLSQCYRHKSHHDHHHLGCDRGPGQGLHDQHQQLTPRLLSQERAGEDLGDGMFL